MQPVSEKVTFSEDSQEISSILDKCISIERYTQKKYKQLLKQTENERARDLFEQLSQAGEAHAEMLTQIKHELKQTGEISNTLVMSAKLEIPKTEKIPATSGIKQTYYALIKHLDLEYYFKETYTKLSEEVNSPHAKEILRLLVIEETNHHQKLKELIKAFEEVYSMLFEKKLD
jgi:rubrerythrin